MVRSPPSACFHSSAYGTESETWDSTADNKWKILLPFFFSRKFLLFSKILGNRARFLVFTHTDVLATGWVCLHPIPLAALQA